MNRNKSFSLAFFLLLANLFSVAQSTDPKPPVTRRIHFHYGVTIENLVPGDKVRIWTPVIHSNHEQTAELLAANEPVASTSTHTLADGNEVRYFEGVANEKGEIPIELDYAIERRELVSGQGEPEEVTLARKHLGSSTLVPADGQLVQRLFADQRPTGSVRDKAHQVYLAVDDLLRYDKPEGKPWGRGDALWACDSHYGNCTDFHSIFIGDCRDLDIPAKFEIGFSIPEKHGSGEVTGYHCWAKYFDRRWEGVDISEADKHPELKDYYFGNLTADRVCVSTGRDLQLEPPSEAGPVNFLVYPYVEANGKPHSAMRMSFRYEDRE